MEVVPEPAASFGVEAEVVVEPDLEPAVEDEAVEKLDQRG